MPGLIRVHDRRAGDVMVDGSLRGERLRPLVLCWITAGGRVSQKLRELTGRLGAIWEAVGVAERVGGSTGGGSADRLECLRAEFAQGVETAPGELAGDRQRCPRVREPARLERQVVGAAGARRTRGRLR